jgi:hypothetical protein
VIWSVVVTRKRSPISVCQVCLRTNVPAKLEKSHELVRRGQAHALSKRAGRSQIRMLSGCIHELKHSKIDLLRPRDANIDIYLRPSLLELETHASAALGHVSKLAHRYLAGSSRRRISDCSALAAAEPVPPRPVLCKASISAVEPPLFFRLASAPPSSKARTAAAQR